MAFKTRIVVIRWIILVVLGTIVVSLGSLGLLHVADRQLRGQGSIAIGLLALSGLGVGGLVISRELLRSRALKLLPLRCARVVEVNPTTSAVTLALEEADGKFTYVVSSAFALADTATVEFGQALAIRVLPDLGDPIVDWPETHRRFARPQPVIATIQSVQQHSEDQAVLSLLVEGPEGLGLLVSRLPCQVDAVSRPWLRQGSQLAVRVTSSGVVFDWNESSRRHEGGVLRPSPSREELRAQATARETQQRAHRVAALTYAIERLDRRLMAYRSGRLSTTTVVSVALLVGINGTILSTVVLRPWLFPDESLWLVVGASFVISTAMGTPLAWAAEMINERGRRAQVAALERQVASLQQERASLERRDTRGGPFR